MPKFLFFLGQCRNLRFKSAPIYGQRLNNHVIRTIDAMNDDFCEMQCYLEPNCVSYNFKNNGEHKCDLNNATYEHDNEHSGDLAKNENYVHRGAEVNIKPVTVCNLSSYYIDLFGQYFSWGLFLGRIYEL